MSAPTRQSSDQQEQHGHDGAGMMRWLLTYADMITLLLAFFIGLYASWWVNAKKLQEVAASIRGAFGTPAGASQINDRGFGGERLLILPNRLVNLAQALVIP